MPAGGIIVTGASKGIGEAIAQRLCQLGQRVIIDGRSEGLLNEVAASCNNMAGEDACIACAGDVTDIQHINELVRLCVDKFGGIKSIICNAGISEPLGSLGDINVTDFR